MKKFDKFIMRCLLCNYYIQTKIPPKNRGFLGLSFDMLGGQIYMILMGILLWVPFISLSVFGIVIDDFFILLIDIIITWGLFILLERRYERKMEIATAYPVSINVKLFICSLIPTILSFLFMFASAISIGITCSKKFFSV